MHVWTIFAAVAALAAAPVAAQETRLAADDHVPPPAAIEQLDWLVGHWSGEGIAGVAAHESWLPPSGGTMVGTFVQETGEGEVMFTEHMYLAEEDGSLVVKLKHFNPDLTGWEEKDEMVSFPLLAIEECAAYFSALTYRCDGADGLLVAVRVKGAGEAAEELVFRFTRIR